jgi:hypothetical protein
VALNAPPPAPTAEPEADPDWTSRSLTVSCGSYGHPQGVARVRNDSGVKHLVVVRYTLVRGTATLAVLRGGAAEVAPGATATIHLIGGGPCVAKPYVPVFHVDLVQ